MLIEGMEQSVQKIKYEILKAIKHTRKLTNTPSDRLLTRVKEVETLQQTFGAYLTERPFVF